MGQTRNKKEFLLPSENETKTHCDTWEGIQLNNGANSIPGWLLSLISNRPSFCSKVQRLTLTVHPLGVRTLQWSAHKLGLILKCELDTPAKKIKQFQLFQCVEPQIEGPNYFLVMDLQPPIESNIKVPSQETAKTDVDATTVSICFWIFQSTEISFAFTLIWCQCRQHNLT